MAPPKRKSTGRTTPKGTRPGQSTSLTAHGTSASTSVGHSSRYTPPIPKSVRESPRWVPVLMLVLLGLGALLILGRYLAFSDSNWPLFLGLACVLGGLYTATRWH